MLRTCLPPAALVAMKPDGGIALGRVLGSLLKQPAQMPALIRTARASNRAFAELLRCRDLLGVGLAGPDLGHLLLDMAREHEFRRPLLATVSMSGAIGPSVFTPRTASGSVLQRMLDRSR